MGKSHSKKAAGNSAKKENSKSISEITKNETNGSFEGGIKRENKNNKNCEPKKKKSSFFSIKKSENTKLERDKRRKSQRKKEKLIEKVVENKITDIKQFSEQEYESSVQQKLQKLLSTDCDKFLLNFMLLSVQFYSNYERDTYDTIDRNRTMENDKTRKVAEHLKTVLLLDPVSDAVDCKVKFQARHGPLKQQILSLDTQTMFVVFDNIEISQPDDTTVYSTLSNSPAYKFVMEDHIYQGRQGPTATQKSHVGYVKLRSIDVINGEIKKTSTTLSETPSTSSGIQSATTMNSDDDFDELRKSLPRGAVVDHKKSICYVNGIPFSTVSVSSRASSEYDYAYITAFNSHKPLSSLMAFTDESQSPTQLPVDCITMINREDEIESDGSESDEETDEIMADIEDEDEEKASTIKNTSVFGGGDQKAYLNSKGFLGYFINIFRSELASDLGFTQDGLDKATWKAAAVFVPPYEIIPAIHCPWPNEAFEWSARKRDPIQVPFTNRKLRWPSPKMISDVLSFGCHLIPVGYAPKKGENPNRHIEWKVVFPQAERYLEQNLTSAQIKVYMIVKALFKTFIDTRLENGKNFFTKEHLRTQLFWLCEENPAAWNEEYLGEALMRYIKALLASINKHMLPDYFLRKRNLLSNVPERVCSNLHKLLYRIYENPVFHVIGAMRNLIYNKNFYSLLPIKKLYRILIVDDPLYLMAPQNFPPLVSERKESVSSVLKETVAIGSMGEFEKRDHKLKRRKPKPKVVQEVETKDARRHSVESINCLLQLPKNLENTRLTLIFHFFVNHLIPMAQKSIEYGAVNTTLLCLKQAQRLCNLLKDYGDTEEAENYLKQIEPMMQQTRKYMRYNPSTTGPSLPQRRGSTEPPYGVQQRKRSLGESTLNVQRRKSSVDSDDTMIASTKTRRKPPTDKYQKPAGYFKVKAQVHSKYNNNNTNDEYKSVKRKESSSSIGAIQPIRDNVRIRA